MKGVSFQNGVEFRVVIEGESWSQGALIQGKIEAKPIAQTQVLLAEGMDKKVKLKSPDAFIILEEALIKTSPYEWKFQLPIDARISDTKGSLYLLYGHGENIEKLGQLRLHILPHLMLRDLSDLITSHFRFALKTISSGKSGGTEFKFGPPSNNDWKMLDELALQLKISPEILDVKFIFHRQEVDALKGGLATKSVKREVIRSWNIPQIILSFNQRLDKEILAIEIDKVISEYRNAGWLSS